VRLLRADRVLRPAIAWSRRMKEDNALVPKFFSQEFLFGRRCIDFNPADIDALSFSHHRRVRSPDEGISVNRTPSKKNAYTL